MGVNRIAQLRNEKGLTQQELADKLNITRASLSHYEADRRDPDTDTLKKLADYFEVSIDYLVGRDNISNNTVTSDIIKQAEDAFKVDPDMLVQMCRAVDLPKEERDKIKEYSAMLIEKFLRERAEKENKDKE